MPDNTCICCGRIIPEGRHICLACGDYDDMQTFRPSSRAHYPEPVKPQKKRYFRIVDDCGFVHYVSTERQDLIAANIVLLTPHVRSAAQISEEEYEAAVFREVHQ